MPVNIVLRSSDSPSGLGIRQLESRMEVFTGCCGAGLRWTWYWTCDKCGLRKPGDELWQTVVILESTEAVHKWTYAYMEELHTFVAQWTGLPFKGFELNYDAEETA